MEWLKSFFAVDNAVNENTVFAVVSFGLGIGLLVSRVIEIEAFYTLMGFTAGCLGFSLAKR